MCSDAGLGSWLAAGAARWFPSNEPYKHRHSRSVDKRSYFSESPLASKYLSSGASLLDRRTAESNQDSLVSVRMKFCSALRKWSWNLAHRLPAPPGSLSLQRATKQVAKPFGVPSISLQLITHRATVSVVLFYNSRLSEHKGAREEAFRSGNRKVSEGWDVLGLFLSYQLPTHCSFRGVSWSGSPIWFMLELPWGVPFCPSSLGY